MSIRDFETRLLEELSRLKERLRADESLCRMTLTITAEGRMDGDLLVTFKLGEYTEIVEGGDLDSVAQEFLRQRGWNARHAPLCLPNVQGNTQPAELDDEVPF